MTKQRLTKIEKLRELRLKLFEEKISLDEKYIADIKKIDSKLFDLIVRKN